MGGFLDLERIPSFVALLKLETVLALSLGVPQYTCCTRTDYKKDLTYTYKSRDTKGFGFV